LDDHSLLDLVAEHGDTDSTQAGDIEHSHPVSTITRGKKRKREFDDKQLDELMHKIIEGTSLKKQRCETIAVIEELCS